MDLGVSIQRGLAYLRQAQRADGGFDSFSSPKQQPFQTEHSYHTTFAPALILNALADIPDAIAIRTPLAGWLLAQKSQVWYFNYWAADAPQRKTLPYPDDLDDTFCALAALFRHDPALVNAAALGSIVRLLLAAESQVGGPYRTWLVPKNAAAIWQDVDLAVNSNIAYFLQLVAQPLPNLDTYMEQAIASATLVSPYYPNPYPLAYYLSRAYQGRLAPQLRAYILRRRRHGHWGSPLRTALALSALHQLGGGSDQAAAVSYLLDLQRPDGSWAAKTFCLDPARQGMQYYSGAPALTTALALEALCHSMPQTAADTPAVHRAPIDHRADTLYKQVVAQATAEYKALPGSALRKTAQTTLERMVRGDHNREIILLPLFFAQSLATSAAPPHAVLVHLGLANLYGWTAYTIYDDFLDASGETRLLPLASTALRLSLERFAAAVPRSPAYRDFVQSAFNRIDAANAWEVAECQFAVRDGHISIGRLPRYGGRMQLAERSLGHALPALGVLARLGIAPNDRRTQKLVMALRHYLVARQLGDDIRDWQADFSTGSCTYVVTKILADLGIAPNTYAVSELLPRMQHEFAEHTLPDVSAVILQHTASARRALAQSTLVAPHTPIGQLVDRLEVLAKRQLAEHTDAQTFLAAYRQA